MERAAFQFLKRAEHSWWYAGRRWSIQRALARMHFPWGTVLDFGAGFGASYAFLSRYGIVDAYEIDRESVTACGERGYRHVYTELPPAAGQYALIGAFDVIEHVEDDVAALRQLHARLQEDGLIVVTVPAYQWLWSAHDELHKHFRRYTRGSISIALAKAGFTIEYSSYWNMTLLPIAFLMRKMGKGGGESLTPISPIGTLLSALLWIESRLMPLMRLPWGTGIVIVGRK